MDISVVSIGEVLFDVFPDRSVLGGAPLNFIYHINKLTGSGTFISSVGSDAPGDQILSFLEAGKLNTETIQRDPNHQTGKALVELSETGEPCFKIVEECAYDYINLNPEINLLAVKSDILYYGTLAQRNIISRETIRSLRSSSRVKFCDLNIRQKFYSKQIILDSLLAADILKLNDSEIKLVCRLLYEKDILPREFSENALRLMDDFRIDLLCLTLNENGSYLFRAGQSSFFPASKVEIADTVGAGDAFSSILALGFLSDWDLDRINAASAWFAGAVCSISGAVPDNDEIYSQFAKRFL